MERLTKRIDENHLCIEVCEEACIEGNTFCPKCKPFTGVLKKLMEYEDLEEQGLLLKLPCKVGDVLYLVYDCGRNPEMIEAKVESFELEKCHSITRIKIYFEGRTGFETCLLDGTLNDGVFLTKAEAEKALAEMEK